MHVLELDAGTVTVSAPGGLCSKSSARDSGHCIRACSILSGNAVSPSSTNPARESSTVSCSARTPA
jgi:hypothetical protein